MKPRSGPAFTLIELLVVVTIIIMLAALLLPTLQNARRRAKAAVCTSNMRQTMIAIEAYRSDNGDYPHSAYTPVDTESKADYIRLAARGGYAMEWVDKLGAGAVSNAGFRCTGSLPADGERNGSLAGDSETVWIFEYRPDCGLFGQWNDIRNKDRNWFIYFGPIPFYYYDASRYFDDWYAQNAAYTFDDWRNRGVPYLSNNPGIGNSQGNRVLTKDTAVVRPLLACPTMLYHPAGSTYATSREPHMDQPVDITSGWSGATAWQIEARNWGFTDGRVEFFNRR